MSTPNPYESPRHHAYEAESDASEPKSESLELVVEEARRTAPWLLALAILLGAPAGFGIISVLIAAAQFGALIFAGPILMGLILLLLVVWVVVQSTSLRYSIRALQRDPTVVRETKMLNDYASWFVSLAVTGSVVLLWIGFFVFNSFTRLMRG